MGFTDPNELLTRVTDDDSVVLGPVERRRVHGDPSLIHRSVHVLVLHPDGRLLLQKRSSLKDTYPGRWDTSVGGHVSFGQTYLEAALREASEELGLSLAPADLAFAHALRVRLPTESENTATYVCVHAGPYAPEPEEIDEVRLWTRAGIEAELGRDVFTPHFEQEFAALIAGPFGARLA